jgi:hypothetical protein
MKPITRLLTLDIATDTGWCAGDVAEGTPGWGNWKLPPNIDLPLSLIAYGDWLNKLCAIHQPQLVVIEEPPNPAWGGGKTNYTTLKKLMALAQKAEEICARRKIECREIGVTRWRTALGCPARIGGIKPYPVFAQLEARGFEVGNHNAADAVGLWLYALAFLDKLHGTQHAARFDPLARGQHGEPAKLGVRKKGARPVRDAGMGDRVLDGIPRDAAGLGVGAGGGKRADGARAGRPVRNGSNRAGQPRAR